MIHTEKAVVAHLKGWAREHLGRHDSPEYHRYHQAFAELLAAKRSEQQAEHDNQGAFGMASAAGCMRAMAFKRAGEKQEFSGDELATWEIGHLVECMTLALLQVSGFTVQTHNVPGIWQSGPIRPDPGLPRGSTQIVASLPPAHHSYTDGILRGGPIALPYPLALSIKSASYKSSGRQGSTWKRYGFAALPLDGIHRAQPSWWLQSQLEMEGLGLAHALVIAAAKDMIKAFDGDSVFQESGSLTWYAEVVPKEAGIAPSVAAGYERILSTAPMVVPPVVVHPHPEKWFVKLPAPGDVSNGWRGPNAEATGTFGPCFGCGFAEKCRGVA
jgi:hypothetical protein